ncbi:MAG: winged helix-turn-helix transcriptional regulator [Thermoplasmata archaeon]
MSRTGSGEAPFGHLPNEPCRDGGRALCPVVAAVGAIGTKWRLVVVHRLLDGPQRFSELLRSHPGLNAKTLSATVRYLERAGVVSRTVVSTRPFVVVYSLTEMGRALAPATRELRLWGERFLLPRMEPRAHSARPRERASEIPAAAP